MSARIGLNMGPVHVSKSIRRKGPGPLTNILVWSILWPFKLLALAFRAGSKPRARQYGHTVVMSGYDLPAFRAHPNAPFQPGWYNVNGQAWYWTGTGWTR